MKVFCIGANKTGTTSLTSEFKRLGFRIAPQEDFERLFLEYKDNKFDTLLEMCDDYDFFQDIPFSLPETYKHLHKKYPDAKFILTVRNTEDEWVESMIRYHTQKLGNLNSDKLKQKYIQNFSMWNFYKTMFEVNEKNPVDINKMKSFYLEHNKEVIEYFKGNSNFMILNLSGQYAYENFQNFIGVRSKFNNFLHLNKSK